MLVVGLVGVPPPLGARVQRALAGLAVLEPADGGAPSCDLLICGPETRPPYPASPPVLLLGAPLPATGAPLSRLSVESSEQSLAAAVQAVAAGLFVSDHLRDLPRDNTVGAFVERAPENGPAEPRAEHEEREELTERERQVLELAALGYSNAEIAGALSISASTVKYHLSASYGRLRAANRTEAITEAVRRGLLSL